MSTPEEKLEVERINKNFEARRKMSRCVFDMKRDDPRTNEECKLKERVYRAKYRSVPENRKREIVQQRERRVKKRNVEVDKINEINKEVAIRKGKKLVKKLLK